MTNEEIAALAREYAEEMAAKMQGSMATQTEAENVIRFLLRRYAPVEKSKLQELDIAFRAKHYGTVVLNQEDIESLFPDLGKEVEQ